MDTKTGKIYGDMETALKNGASPEDLKKLTVMELENNKMLAEILEFLIKDQAFDPAFLLTTIFEYISNSCNREV